MRPLFYEYPDAASLPCDRSMTFLLGAKPLVAASPTPESPQDYRVCLPAGGWFDYWTGLPVPSAEAGEPQLLVETPSPARLPVFVRAGPILPRQPPGHSTMEAPDGPLRLDVYPGDDCEGVLYADDGHGMGYTRGEFLPQRVLCAATDDGLEIAFS